jgi:hypothetical protein
MLIRGTATHQRKMNAGKTAVNRPANGFQTIENKKLKYEAYLLSFAPNAVISEVKHQKLS